MKPFCASKAENTPLDAALPGLKLLFIDPKESLKPTGCEAASPRAQIICSSVKRISLPIAAAAPIEGCVPETCQPMSAWFGARAFDSRIVSSTPR